MLRMNEWWRRLCPRKRDYDSGSLVVRKSGRENNVRAAEIQDDTMKNSVNASIVYLVHNLTSHLIDRLVIKFII